MIVFLEAFFFHRKPFGIEGSISKNSWSLSVGGNLLCGFMLKKK